MLILIQTSFKITSTSKRERALSLFYLFFNSSMEIDIELIQLSFEDIFARKIQSQQLIFMIKNALSCDSRDKFHIKDLIFRLNKEVNSFAKRRFKC
jgi:hypothetical protein